jgi:peptide/nickel transport system substrate-binding protein
VCAFFAIVFVGLFAGRASAGSTLRVDLQDDLDFTDPALSFLQTGWQLEYSTCAKLMNYPDTAGPTRDVAVPEIASADPIISPDGRTYTFTIRAGLHFSNGAAVTPADVAWTFNRALSPAMQSPSVLYVSDLVGEDAYRAGTAPSISGITVSGNTISFQLVHAAGDFVARVAMPFFCVLPQTVPIDPNGVLAPPTAGPYFIVSRIPNKEIVIRRNPFYTGSRPAHFDGIDYQIGTQLDATEARVQAGTADYAAQGLPLGDYQAVHDAFGDGSPAALAGSQQFFVNQEPGFQYLALNTDPSRTVFRNPLLRRAVSFAVDRAALANAAGAFATTPTDQYLPPGIPGFVDGDFYPLAGPDLVTARTLALEAGVSQASPVTAVLYTANTGSGPVRALLIQQELAQIGVNVTIDEFQRGVQIAKEGTHGEPFDLTLEGWIADYADPFDFLNTLLNGETITPTNNVNVSYFNDPAFNARLDAASVLTGQARYDTYTGIERDLLRTEAPLVAFDTFNARDFFSSRVGCQTYVRQYGMDLGALCQRAPVVSSIAPPTGAVGSIVVLAGRNFTDATSVSLCSVAASFTAVSDTEVDATVPAGACDGFWSVTTGGGTGTAATAFVVVPPTCATATPLLGTTSLASSAVDSSDAGRAESFSATAGASGTAAVMCVYVDASNTATHLVAGIYTDNAGHPGALLAQGALATAPVGATFNTIQLPRVPLAAGTRYWISILSPFGSRGDLRFRDGCCGHDSSSREPSERSKQETLTALPGQWVGKSPQERGPLVAWSGG